MTEALKFQSIEDWLALPDDARCELVEGEFFRKALPSSEHSYSHGRLMGMLYPYDKGGGGGGPGGWWFGVEAHVVYEGRPNGFIHDLAGWRRDRHGERPKGRRISSTPDWVCEIVSSNRSDDDVKKKRVLHEHRVAYYWLLDHRDKVLIAQKWVEGGFLVYHEAPRGEIVRLEPFPEVEIDTEALFGED